MSTSGDLPPVGAVLSGPHWPGRVRVVRIEPRGSARVLIEAVTLDPQSRLISRLLKREDLTGLSSSSASIAHGAALVNHIGSGQPHRPSLPEFPDSPPTCLDT